MEIRDMLSGKEPTRKPGVMNGFWLIILQIGIIDIVFSLDSVFTAVGLAKHIEVMIAAIVVSVLVMMVVSSAVSRFIERYPDHQGAGAGVPGAGGAALIARVRGPGDSAGLFVFRDGVRGRRGMGQHSIAAAGVMSRVRHGKREQTIAIRILLAGWHKKTP